MLKGESLMTTPDIDCPVFTVRFSYVSPRGGVSHNSIDSLIMQKTALAKYDRHDVYYMQVVLYFQTF